MWATVDRRMGVASRSPRNGDGKEEEEVVRNAKSKSDASDANGRKLQRKIERVRKRKREGVEGQ